MSTTKLARQLANACANLKSCKGGERGRKGMKTEERGGKKPRVQTILLKGSTMWIREKTASAHQEQ